MSSSQGTNPHPRVNFRNGGTDNAMAPNHTCGLFTGCVTH